MWGKAAPSVSGLDAAEAGPEVPHSSSVRRFAPPQQHVVSFASSLRTRIPFNCLAPSRQWSRHDRIPAATSPLSSRRPPSGHREHRPHRPRPRFPTSMHRRPPILWPSAPSTTPLLSRRLLLHQKSARKYGATLPLILPFSGSPSPFRLYSGTRCIFCSARTPCRVALSNGPSGSHMRSMLPSITSTDGLAGTTKTALAALRVR